MIRTSFRFLCLVLFVAAIFVTVKARISGADDHAVAASAETVVSSEKQSDENTTSRDVAVELERKRVENSKKETELAGYEKKLKDQETALNAKLKELEVMRAAISGELEGQKKDNEDRVTKMVTVFETMSPKSAAAVMETIDDWLAVDVLKRMDVKRMAKIMNTMDKSRSAKLSELMTGYVHKEKIAKNTAGQAANAEVARTPAQAPAAPVMPASPKVEGDNLKKGGKP